MTKMEMVVVADNDPASPGASCNGESPVHGEHNTQEQFNQLYGYHTKHKPTLKESLSKSLSKCQCSLGCVKDKTFSCFPFLGIMKKYRVKRDLLADIISGITVGIMHIPQGLAYGLLASMSPMHGLYVSFFPPLVYFFLGSSKHISLGTMSIIAMMTGVVVEKSGCQEKYMNQEEATTGYSVSSTIGPYLNTSTSLNLSDVGLNNEMASQIMTCKAVYATSLAFLVGMFQIVFGLLKLGFITTYLSDPVTRAFTTGAAVHVFTSQIQLMFGIKTKRYNGILKLVYVYRDFFGMISQTNWASVIMAILCAAFLIIFKEVINPKVKAKIKMPIPAELLLVIFATLVSYLGQFETRFSMRVVGLLPTGLPPPKIPDTSIFPQLIVDAFLIAMIAFVINVSLAKLFAKMQTYNIDPSQEFVAYGMTNLVSSVFLCFPSAAALSRSLIQENLGGRTQVASLVSCCLMLVVLFGVGILFEALPNNVLAVIITVNLKGMFWQFKDIPRLWRVSKPDLVVWLSVFLGVVFLDVDLGLLFGVGVCLFTVVFMTQSPQADTLGQAGNTGIFRSTATYTKVEENPDIKVFQFASSLYYASCEHFLSRLYKRSGVDPIALKIARDKYNRKKKKVPTATLR